MGVQHFPPHAAGGLKRLMYPAISVEVGDTETMAYWVSFYAEATRNYRIQLRSLSVDTNDVGDNVYRGAKQSAVITCRWAPGSSVTTSSATLGGQYVTCFVQDSSTSSGVLAMWYLIQPPTGTLTIGITLRAARPSASFGTVRLLPNEQGFLSIEDVGGAL